jgi:acyl carrier protein
MHDVPAWDSVAHLNLIFAIEEAFAVKFQTELIPQLDSIAKLRAAIAQGAAFDPGSMA